MSYILLNILITFFASILLSIGFISLFIKKANNTIDSMHVGIKRIYARGTNIKSMEKSLLSVKELYIIAYAGDGFIQGHREVLKKALQNSASIFVLVGTKNSDYLKEASRMENLSDNHIDNKVDTVIDELKTIKALSKNTKGTIEARCYNTELRNPMIICKNDEITKAWVTIFIPPKRAADCLMVEFEKKEKVDDCLLCFNTIWNLHKKDIIRI
jgi:phosphopantetheine adenylyltransferase